MLQSIIKRSVKEIVGKLTKAEVIASLPIGWTRWEERRTWSSLNDVIDGLSDDRKAEIYEAACTKDRLLKEKMVAGRKRKRMEYEWSKRSRQRLNDGE
jgi:hypothetical protein